MASVPELAKKTRPSAPSSAEQPLGQLDLGLVQEQVAGVREPRDLAGDGLDQRRVAVAERADRDPGDQVEVLVAVGVPHLAALAADQRDGGCP